MWDKIYDKEEYVYGKLPNDFLKGNYDVIPKGKVLLLAEGEGRNAVFLAKLGYSVTAVDISSVAIKKLEKLANGVFQGSCRLMFNFMPPYSLLFQF